MRIITFTIWLILFTQTLLCADSMRPLNDVGHVYSLDSDRYLGVDYIMYQTTTGWAIELRSENPRTYKNLRALVEKAVDGQAEFLITFDFTPDPGRDCDGNEFDHFLDQNDKVETNNTSILIYLVGSRKWVEYNFSRLKVFIDDHDINESRCNEVLR